MVGFVLLTTPALPAIEYNSAAGTKKPYSRWGPDIDPEELKEMILERIEELLQHDISFINRLILDPSDPDGPYRGGLDDPTDFLYLFWGLIETGMLAYCFKEGLLRNPVSLLMFIHVLLVEALCVYGALIHFGEAFDVIEIDNDGC
jgi:hypothetical protein